MATPRDRSVTLHPVGVLWYQCEGVCVYVCVRVLDHRVGAIPSHCVTGCLLVTVTVLNLWLVQLITRNETRWLLLYCFETVRHVRVLTTQTLYPDSVARFSGK